MSFDAVDLFSGLGGWSVACRQLGLSDVGLELDRDACLSRSSEGYATIRCDVARYPRRLFVGVEGVIASPPCQPWSQAGKRSGINDARGQLVHQPLEWVLALRPRWAAFEQVPAVLPIWRHNQRSLEAHGYHVWVGILNSANFGVPQTRERAVLIAHRDRVVTAPEPTHAEHGHHDLFSTRLPWVTMLDALGWDGMVGFPRLEDGRGDQHNLNGYRKRDWRPTNLPALTLTEKARSWVLNTGLDWKPGGTRADAQKIDMHTQPAPTLTGVSGRQWQVSVDDQTRNISVDEALVLQSFRPGYRAAGTRTSQFLQVGNAIPPLLAEHVLGQVCR